MHWEGMGGVEDGEDCPIPWTGGYQPLRPFSQQFILSRRAWNLDSDRPEGESLYSVLQTVCFGGSYLASLGSFIYGTEDKKASQACPPDEMGDTEEPAGPAVPDTQ